MDVSFIRTLSYTFVSYSYLINKATADTSIMNSAVYNVDCKNFTLETYYTIIAKSFNDLAAAGSAYALDYTKIVNSIGRVLK